MTLFVWIGFGVLHLAIALLPGVNDCEWLKWHDCWPGHCIMDELQPLIYPWATSSSSFSLCVLLSALYNWREWREQKDDGNVTLSEWERALTFKREREAHCVSLYVTSIHTCTQTSEDSSSVRTEISTK